MDGPLASLHPGVQGRNVAAAVIEMFGLLLRPWATRVLPDSRDSNLRHIAGLNPNEVILMAKRNSV